MTGVITRLIAVTLLATSAPAVAQSASLDDLVRVSSGRAGALYLRPHADFRSYRKVRLQPSEIAFDKDWARDFNRSTRSLRNRVSDQDARRAIEEWQPRVDRIFADAFTRNALAPVAEAGPDVLMIRPVIINVRVTAPERPASGRVRTFAREAGSATLVLEARDSLTRQLVGVAVENRVVRSYHGP